MQRHKGSAAILIKGLDAQVVLVDHRDAGRTNHSQFHRTSRTVIPREARWIYIVRTPFVGDTDEQSPALRPLQRMPEINTVASLTPM